MLRIATNTMGLNAHRSLKNVSTNSGKASEKLSSGLKINRAADDAAGLAISEKMRNQISGLNRAQRNVEDGISLIQTAEGGMNEIGEMLKRQRELTIQAMNDTNVSGDKDKIQQEIDQLSKEITSMAEKTEFNTIPLLTGGAVVETFYFTLAPGTSTFSPVDTVALRAGESFTVAVKDLTVPGGQNTTQVAINKQPAPGVYDSGPSIDINALNPGVVSGDSKYESLERHGSSYSKTNSGFSSPIYGGDGSSTINNVSSDGYWYVIVANHNSTDPSKPAETSFMVTFTYNDRGVGDLYIKSGANEDQGMYIKTYDCRADSLGVDPLKVEPLSAAELSLSSIDNAIETINSYRATAGAQQNRLEHTGKNLGTSSENLEISKSRITDTDMAKEMMEFTKGNILQQAGMSMLAQANQAPQRVLEILR